MLQPTPLGSRAFYLWGFGLPSCQICNGGSLQQSGKTFPGWIKVILWELPFTWRQKQTSLGLCWSGFHIFCTPPLQSRIALIARRCPRNWHEQVLTCLVCLTDPPALPKCHLYQRRKCQRRPEQLTAIILVHLIQNLKKQRTFCKKLHLWCSTPNCYWVFWSARFISESTESAVSFSIPDQFHLSKPSEFGTAAREVASAHDIFALFILRCLFQCCSKWRKSGTATNVVIHRSLRLEPGRAFFGAFQTVPKFPLHVTNGVRVDVSKHEWLQFQRKICTSSKPSLTLLRLFENCGVRLQSTARLSGTEGDNKRLESWVPSNCCFLSFIIHQSDFLGPWIDCNLCGAALGKAKIGDEKRYISQAALAAVSFPTKLHKWKSLCVATLRSSGLKIVVLNFKCQW